jgi:hypothetical protein
MNAGLGEESFILAVIQVISQYLDIGILVVNILLLVSLVGLLGEILDGYQ